MPKKLAESTYLDIRDLTWEYLSDKSCIQRVAKFVFRFVAKKKIGVFSAISVTNPCEYKYCAEVLYFPQQTTVLVPNGISQENFQKLSSISLSLPKVREQIVITYIGNVGIPQNLSIYIEAAICCPNLIFNIVGSGENLSEVQKLKDKKNVSNVKFLGSLPWHELESVYAETDILYAQLNHDFSGAIPSKLYEYLSTGKFFIYGGAGEALEMLDDFEHYMAIEPDNATRLVEAINQIVKEELWSELSSANRLKIENNYIREHHVERWLEAIA
jgi:glycosyltransferase involved in cell wall biosynthesis